MDARIAIMEATPKVYFLWDALSTSVPFPNVRNTGVTTAASSATAIEDQCIIAFPNGI